MLKTREEHAAVLAQAEVLHHKALTVTTRDLGLAIRDFIEGRDFAIFDGDQDSGARVEIDFVDVSDPHNPVVHLSNGRVFRVSIVAA